MNIRDNIVDVAFSVVGYGENPRDPEMRQAYIDLIAPGETPIMQAGMIHASGCGLTVGGIWRRAGLVDKRLDPPYKVGHAIARLIEIAKDHNGWKVYKGSGMPEPGDMVMVGDNGAGGTQHVYTVTSVDVDTKVIESVDGGMRDTQGFETIKRKRRIWSGGTDAMYENMDHPAKIYGGRKIIGWVDVTTLPIPVVDIYKDE